MKIFLIVLGVVAALWVLWMLLQALRGRGSRGYSQSDREAVDEWVKESAQYKNVPEGGRRKTAARPKRKRGR